MRADWLAVPPASVAPPACRVVTALHVRHTVRRVPCVELPGVSERRLPRGIDIVQYRVHAFPYLGRGLPANHLA